jgi:hypothetical protein
MSTDVIDDYSKERRDRKKNFMQSGFLLPGQWKG